MFIGHYGPGFVAKRLRERLKNSSKASNHPETEAVVVFIQDQPIGRSYCPPLRQRVWNRVPQDVR
jgi:hypothetical protein